jgi:hypothetical protein
MIKLFTHISLLLYIITNIGCNPSIPIDDSLYSNYYSFDSLKNYLNNNISTRIKEANYTIKTIGKSVEGRNLYSIQPESIENKKTIIITCRHHGDEYTSNWILEGFINKLFTNDKDLSAWLNEFQVIIYPMLNPDGAQKNTRKNANKLDLNRLWRQDTADEQDEIKIIHSHLNKLLSDNGLTKKQVKLILDLHGSFEENFIFRVPRDRSKYELKYNKKFFPLLSDREYELYYQEQEKFINEIVAQDPYFNPQKPFYGFGAINSFGRKGMMRITLGEQGFNVLTHEMIRFIHRDNRFKISVNSLKKQGEAIFWAIFNFLR